MKQNIILPAAILAFSFALVATTSADTISLFNSTENEVLGDSTIRSTQANANNGSNGQLLVGTVNGSDLLRGAVSFDLSAPELTGATINSATLTFELGATDGSSDNVDVEIGLYELSVSFTETGVTWNSRNGTDNWTTPGGDFGGLLASVTDNPNTAAVGDSYGFTSITLANSVQSSIGGNIYFLSKLVNEQDARQLFRFASDDTPTASAIPTLTIDYTPVPEPSTFAFLLLPVTWVAIRRRKR